WFSQVLGFKSFYDLKQTLKLQHDPTQQKLSGKMLEGRNLLLDLVGRKEQTLGFLFLFPNGDIQGFGHGHFRGNQSDKQHIDRHCVLTARQTKLIQDYLFSKIDIEKWDELCVDDHIYLSMEQDINDNLQRDLGVQLYKRDEKDKHKTVIKLLFLYKTEDDNFYYMHFYHDAKHYF